LASNDGYLLKNFIEKGIPALGVEPADNVAAVAIGKGVPTVVKFFGVKTAKELVADGIQADLMCANNVLAHVPDLNDFVAGMKIVLKPKGVITVEFPHLMRQIEGNQFDQIYQEHYCYYSLHTLLQVFDHHGMTIFDVDELTTHGGSLRIYIRHKEDQSKPVSENVTPIHQSELEKGYDKLGVYQAFAEQVRETKRQFLEFLIQAKREGKQVVGYGAPVRRIRFSTIVVFELTSSTTPWIVIPTNITNTCRVRIFLYSRQTRSNIQSPITSSSCRGI